jgi:8-oxo-dGTP pyrophosphatase MutT (NUDIX family)
MQFDVLPDGRLVADTAGMAAVTQRKPATIRVICRELREEVGYDVDVAKALLAEQPTEPVLLTAAEVELYLGIPPNRLYQWVHRKLLKPVDRVGRSPRYWIDDLDRLRKSNGRSDTVTGGHE